MGIEQFGASVEKYIYLCKFRQLCLNLAFYYKGKA